MTSPDAVQLMARQVAALGNSASSAFFLGLELSLILMGEPNAFVLDMLLLAADARFGIGLSDAGLVGNLAWLTAPLKNEQATP